MLKFTTSSSFSFVTCASPHRLWWRWWGREGWAQRCHSFMEGSVGKCLESVPEGLFFSCDALTGKGTPKTTGVTLRGTCQTSRNPHPPFPWRQWRAKTHRRGFLSPSLSLPFFWLQKTNVKTNTSDQGVQPTDPPMNTLPVGIIIIMIIKWTLGT